MNAFVKLTGIKRLAVHDGDGVRTTVFFAGCPLKCIWCHNPESILYNGSVAFYKEKCIGCRECAGVCDAKAVTFGAETHLPVTDKDKCTACGKCAGACPVLARKMTVYKTDVKSLAAELLRDKELFTASNGGVTLSGGECLTQADAAVSLAKEMRKNGVGVDIDTCGFVPFDSFFAIMPYCDTFLFDIKAWDGELHKRLTGRDNGLILENLERLCLQKAKIEIRIPLVAGYNDGEVTKIAKGLSAMQNGNISGVRVLRYHDFARFKYRALDIPDTMPTSKTSETDVLAAENILREAGLTVLTDK